jgi:hypothetical protein
MTRVPSHRLLPVAGLCVVSVVVGSSCLAQPAGVVGLYDELRMAIETEDANAVAAQMAPVALLEASQPGGWLNDLGVLFTQRDGLAVELRLDSAEVMEQRALCLVTWAFTGKTADTGEAWNATEQRLDFLVQTGGAWKVLGSDALDPEATKVTDGQYLDSENGLEAAAPARWRLFALKGMRAACVAVSLDLTCSLTWLVLDLPGTFTSDQLATTSLETVQKLAPALGLEISDITSETAELSGRPAQRIGRTVMGGDGLQIRSDVTFCVAGETLFLCARSACPPTAMAACAAAMDAAAASTRIVEVQPGALPAEAGRLEGRKYINDTHGCEITGPAGWALKIGRAQFKLQVTMYEPGGESNITLGMVDLPRPDVTAEQAILSEDGVASQAFDDFVLVRRGEMAVGDLPAYESVTRFTFGGQPRQRHRVYLVDNNRLFFMFADAVPAEAWPRLSPLFSESFQSFRFIEAQP